MIRALLVLPPSLNGIQCTLSAPSWRDDPRIAAAPVPRGGVRAARRRSPKLTHPIVTLASMVLGVVLGLVVGLSIGVAWYLVRSARTVGAAHVGREPAGGRTGGGRPSRRRSCRRRPRPRRRPRRREPSRCPSSNSCGATSGRRRHGPRRSATGWPGPSRSCRRRRWPRTTSSSWPSPTRSSTRRARRPRATSTQRQQAIAQLLDPLSETLARYELGLRQMELERKGAYEGLSEKVAQLHLGHEQLQQETRNLVTALRSPQTRGRWGEIQLRTRRRDGRHARALRLRRAGVDHHRRGSPASRHDRAHARGSGDRGRRQGARSTRSSSSSTRTTTRPAPSSRPSTPGSCAPTSTSWPRRSTGSSSSAPQQVVAFIPGDQLLVGSLRVRPDAAGVRHGERRAAHHADHADRAAAHGRASGGSRRRWPRARARCRSSGPSCTTACG